MGSPDVVLIVCDTARADAFSAWQGPVATPTMDALCREGRMYEQAVAAAPWTLPSTASLFSGVLPSVHGVSGDCLRWQGVAPTSPAKTVRRYRGPWLPRDLRARGYRTWAATCNPWVSRWSGFGSGFNEFHNFGSLFPDFDHQADGAATASSDGPLDKGGERTVSAFFDWCGSRGSQPAFAFVNLMEVHAPYDPPPPYFPFPEGERERIRAETAPISALRRAMWFNLGLSEPDPKLAAAIRDVYFASAGYEDALLGRMIAAIRDSARPTVVAVVADHGEHLGERGMFGHNTSLYEPLLRVPLVVWGHRVDVPSGIESRPVSLLRLADALLDRAEGGSALPEPDAVVASEYEATSRQNPTPHEIAELIERGDVPNLPSLSMHAGVAVREGSLKYVATEDGHESLHDLSVDPGEERDLASSRPADLERFRVHRDAWRERRSALPDQAVGPVAEDEIVEHLRSLGYVE